MPIEFKKAPYLWAFSALLVVMTGVLIWHKDVTFKEGGAFITGALAMPALFGAKKKDDGNGDGGVTVPVDDSAPPVGRSRGGDLLKPFALNGDKGGTWKPSAPIIIGGAGVGIAPFSWLAVFCVLALFGCKPGQTPRETARATVLVVADAVKQLDTVCAKVATAKHDPTISDRCGDGYDAARAALEGAEKALDAYDAAGAGNLPCAVARSVEGMQKMTAAITAAGGTPPPIVEDALKLTPLLTVACRG